MQAHTARPTVHVHQTAPPPHATPIVIGVPLKHGSDLKPGHIAIHAPDGSICPTSTRTLVAFADGSPRWVLVAFLTRVAGEHTLTHGNSATPPHPVKLTHNANSVTLGNGGTQLAVSNTGPIFKSFTINNEALLDLSDLRFVVDDADTSRETSRTIRVLEQSDVRMRLRIEGGHYRADGSRKLSYRLDVELWAGTATPRLDYHFFNLERGSDYQRVGRMAVEINTPLNTARTRRHFLQNYHGLFYEPREVLNPDAVAIVTDSERKSPHVQDAGMLLDTLDYPAYLDIPLIDTGTWLGVTDDASHVYLSMQDFEFMPPKRLFSDGARIGLEFWPARAGELNLQQGRSRRQVLTLSTASGIRPDGQTIETALSLPLWEGRATVDPTWIAACKEFDQHHLLPFAKHGRIEKYLARILALEMPCDMFDLGDTIDVGYSTSYPSIGLHREPRRPGAPIMPRVFNTHGVLASWIDIKHYDPIWVNNEYDGIHAWASELMRTGSPSRWQTLRWMVRHNIEVDFFHCSDHKWLHRSTPVHSHHHGSSGAYPSHFWTQGLIEYHCLTGDPDALEVAVALGDNIILHFHDPEREKFYRNFDRELGWAVLALVCVYDITREPRFKNEIDRIVEFFLYGEQENTANTTRVISKRASLNHDLVARFYFMLNMVEALDLYQNITGRADIHEWLITFLKPMPSMVFDNFRQGLSAMSAPAALAIAYERGGDPDALRAGMLRLEELTQDDKRWADPSPEIKPMAVLYREFIRFLGHAYRLKLLDAFDYPSLRGR